MAEELGAQPSAPWTMETRFNALAVALPRKLREGLSAEGLLTPRLIVPLSMDDRGGLLEVVRLFSGGGLSKKEEDSGVEALGDLWDLAVRLRPRLVAADSRFLASDVALHAMSPDVGPLTGAAAVGWRALQLVKPPPPSTAPQWAWPKKLLRSVALVGNPAARATARTFSASGPCRE